VLLESMDEQEGKRVVEVIASESEPVRERYTDGSEMVLELSANLAIARG
jgi:hypothetical protein